MSRKVRHPGPRLRKQLTVRGFDDQLHRRLLELASSEGISLSQAALRLMRKGAGIGAPPRREQVVGDALDHLIGTWTEQEAREVLEATGDFEHVEPDMWQ
jgi:hypothetical protein